MTAYPLTANARLYDPAQTEEYLGTLFRHVDWEPGQVISLLGIGEKGTDREGVFRERQIIPPGFIGVAHGHLRRWAEWHSAGFVVPAVLYAAAQDKGDVTLDKVAALTAMLLDLDSGDISAKVDFAVARLGRPTLDIASGGTTDAGEVKRHLYWLFNEPSDEVDRVAALRKLLAAKAGGDQSFGRATQVIRVPGSVHAKNGKAALCSILARADVDYSLDELADIIETMEPMPGVEPVSTVPSLALVGGMDFTPRADTAAAAMHRDVAAGGMDLTRWSEFSKVAGFNISCVRNGSLTGEAAFTATAGWTLAHMDPPWPPARIEQEFMALVAKDIANHGPFPMSRVPWSNVANGTALPLEFFGDIRPSLLNIWRVRDLFPAGGLGLFYGAPGSGKSFLAVDISLRVAAGLQVGGRAVRQCPVVYIAAEGQSGLRNRVAAFRQYHGIEGDLPFAMVPCAVDLLDPKADIGRVIEAVAVAADRWGSPPGLLPIDTLAATFGGGDENSTAMVSYINNVAKLRDAFGATILLVHHRPKDAMNDTPRGHGSLMGAMDTIVRVDGGGVRSATITKQKDAEAGPSLSFSLEGVQLGLDEENEPVLSAVVKYTVTSTEQTPTKSAGIALLALSDAIAEAGGLPVPEAAWRAKWRDQMPAGMKDDAARKSFCRSRDQLGTLGRITNAAGLWAHALPHVASLALSPQAMDFSVTAGAGR